MNFPDIVNFNSLFNIGLGVVVVAGDRDGGRKVHANTFTAFLAFTYPNKDLKRKSRVCLAPAGSNIVPVFAADKM